MIVNKSFGEEKCAKVRIARRIKQQCRAADAGKIIPRAVFVEFGGLNHDPADLAHAPDALVRQFQQ
jgi:hypothetical protein